MSVRARTHKQAAATSSTQYVLRVCMYVCMHVRLYVYVMMHAYIHACMRGYM